MNDYRCKMCGGKLDFDEKSSIVTCPYCGCKQTLPKYTDDRKFSLYSKANDYRLNNEFIKAQFYYELIISEYGNEAEAYWGLVLCKYGIEYVDDVNSEKKIPILHFINYKPILEDADYLNTLEYSDELTKEEYEEEANQINELQTEILKNQLKEKYDVFICYKESDYDGSITEDSIYSKKVYSLLTNKYHLNVFYAKETLKSKAGLEFEPIIFSALYSSKVLIHITTSLNHTNSTWVKSEWKRYCENLKDRRLIVCFKSLNPNTLPPELRQFEGISMEDKDWINTLVKAILSVFKEEEVEESDDIIEIKALLYSKYSYFINNCEKILFSSKDLTRSIQFFETNLDLLDSKNYLVKAKIKFIQHVESLNDCKIAEKYIKDLKDNDDTEKLEEELVQKKIKIKKKYLMKEGLLISVPHTFELNGAINLINFLINLNDKLNNSTEITSNDRDDINKNRDEVVASLRNNLPRIILSSTNLDELNKLKEYLGKLNKDFYGDFIYSFVNLLDERIETIKENENKIKLKKKKKKCIIWGTIGIIILLIIVIIVSTKVSSSINHSPSSISINFKDKKQEYKPDVSPYINGCYYVYFYLDISSSSNVKINDLSFETRIYINDKELGTLNSSLENMELNAKSNKSYTIYLQDNQPEENKNELFINLYNADFSSLSFEYTINSIRFDDGQYYFR